MEPLIKHEGKVALLKRANVDTDQIIPKQFLKRIERTGFGQFLFNDWRFLNDGSNNPDFELNKPEFRGASILLAGDNFGCGSSREHAPWALLDYGFKIIISTSFADIFYNNCFKNGILPISIDAETAEKLIQEVEKTPGASFSVDVEKSLLKSSEGVEISFELDEFRKNSLLKGLDEIGASLEYLGSIASYEEKRKAQTPWL